jgi:transcriptional repressor NrdR
MVCIYCGGDTQVTNSRLQKKSNQVWRRRKCQACQGLFTSIEAANLPSSLLFKRDEEHLGPFQRDILLISIYESCRHRKQAVEAATALTDTVLGKLRHKVKDASLKRQDVIKVTADVLKHYDKAAYTSYLAYHQV